MRQTTNLILLSIFMTLTSFGQSADVMELSVEAAVKYAWENSQKAKTAAIDVQQADKDVWIQASRGLPIVNGSVSMNNFIDLPTSVFDASAFNPLAPPGELAELQFGQPWTMDAGITASLQVFDGSYIIGVKGAKGYQKMSRDIQKMTRNEIETLVGEAYYTSQVAKENVRLLAENIATTEKTVSDTKALFENGFVEEMDVEQLDLLLNGLKTKLQVAERQHKATLNLLKYQMGMPVTTNITLTTDLETLWTLQTPEELLTMELDLNSNLAYDLVKQDVVMHGYLVKLQEAKYYPRLNAFFDYKQQAFRDDFNFYDFDRAWYPQTLWGVQLSVPIWDNLGAAAGIKKAKLEQQKIKNKLYDLEQALTMQAVTAKDNFSSALEELEISTQNIELAKRIKEKTLIKYNEGLASSMELTTAENQLIQAQADYIGTLFQAMNAKLELKKVLENN
ncbi:MAG: TolC family protein [Bacteroidetes bacterium]|nr:MAG: TolC family protein [Bacteroidota bacterium]